MGRGSEVFAAIGFSMAEPHRLHHAVRGENRLGHKLGVHTFVAEVFGDLDDDAMCATFERAETGSAQGVRGVPGLHIDRKLA